MARSKRQKGVILIATLLMVAILAALSIALVTAPTSDQKIAGSTQDQILAKQSANAAIEEARAWLTYIWNNSTTIPVTASCPGSAPTAQGTLLPILGSSFSTDAYTTKAITDPFWANGCTAHNTPICDPQNPSICVAQNGTYIIKYLGYYPSAVIDLYQVIALGVGVSSSTNAYSEALIQLGPSGNNTNINQNTPGAFNVTISAGQLHAWGPSTPTQRWVQRMGAAGANLGGWGWGCFVGWCIEGVSGWQTCQVNGANQVRVSAYSGDDSPPCVTRFGPWVNCPGGTSSLQIPAASSNYGCTNPETLSCGC